MEKYTFAQRLQQLMDIEGIRAADIVRATGISKSRISHYLKGDWEAKQDSIYYISEAYSLDPAWLMGYDVPMKRKKEDRQAELTDLQKQVVDFVLSLPEEKLEALNDFLRRMQ